MCGPDVCLVLVKLVKDPDVLRIPNTLECPHVLAGRRNKSTLDLRIDLHHLPNNVFTIRYKLRLIRRNVHEITPQDRRVCDRLHPLFFVSSCSHLFVGATRARRNLLITDDVEHILEIFFATLLRHHIVKH